MRRNSDQREYKPMAGLLRASGKVNLHYYDVSQDQFIEATIKEEAAGVVEQELDEFLASLAKLESKSVDFREAVYQSCRSQKLSEGVLAYVRKALGD